jgi:Farnesoic acid 0-methyl transferase
LNLFTACAGDKYILYTTSNLGFDQNVMTTGFKFLTFTVQACNNIHIFLTHLPGVVDTLAYKISLGLQENMMSAIEKLPPSVGGQSFNTPGILTCSEQEMWASWTDGRIQVGLGSSVLQNVQFEWIDPQPYAINAFSLASRDTSHVTWTFPRDYCKHSFLLCFLSCLFCTSDCGQTSLP